jgi:hypothetical protein
MKNILMRTTESTGLGINLLSSKKKDIDRKFFCFFFFSVGEGVGDGAQNQGRGTCKALCPEVVDQRL